MLPGFDFAEFVRTYGPAIGYVLLFGIVFAESCLVFFLPGDSLLFTAGVLSSLGFLSLWVCVVGVTAAAVLGNGLGYWIGYRVGRRLFQSPRSRLFRPEHLARAEAFYEKHGGKTIVLARFVPVVRTFAPIVAGMGSMTYPRFAAFNIAGGALWALSMVGGGYAFGSVLSPEQVDRFLLPVIAAIVVISLAPAALHLYQERRAHR
ncbi:MAG TPA: VTT domain-containing protein [Chloroflexota bacterium]